MMQTLEDSLAVSHETKHIFSGGSVLKNLPANAGDTEDTKGSWKKVKYKYLLHLKNKMNIKYKKIKQG